MDAVTGTPAVEPFARAEIVAIGSELLMPPRLDTNSLLITNALNALGIPVLTKAVVSDSVDEVAAVVAAALGRSSLVVLTGGLGPTDDDVTREAVARVVARPLHEDAGLVERLRARFASRNLTMPEINRRQAMVIEGAVVLENDRGTAPGQWLEIDGKALALLPGPPRELEPMLARLVAGPIGARAGDLRLLRRTAFVAGLGESHVEEALIPCYQAWRRAGYPIDVTILAAPGQIELHLTMRGREEAVVPVLDQAVADVRRALGDRVFTTSGQRMEEVVGAALSARGWRIALAESCTGGLTLSRLTDVPGSSAYVEGGVVAYSNGVKTAVLGVPAALIDAHGAVSEPVALAMAEGVRRVTGAEIGVGITGIAGPAGGTDAKPVGTVALAVASPAGSEVRTIRAPGGRTQIKFNASQAALDLIRRVLAAGARRGSDGDA